MGHTTYVLYIHMHTKSTEGGMIQSVEKSSTPRVHAGINK